MINSRMKYYLAAAMAAVVMLLPCRVMAQADAQFSQYFQVKNYYNPAAIGTGDKLNIRGGGRMQWVGVENAPLSFVGTAETALKLFGQRFGAGVLLQQESYGLFKNLNIGAQLGYKLKLFKGKGELTIGLQLGFTTQSFKGTEVFIPDDDDYHQSADNAIPQKDLEGNAFDCGFGLFYTHGIWWGGLSATHLTNPMISLKSETGNTSSEQEDYEFEIARSLYLMAGCNIPIKNTLFEVMPSLFVKSDLNFFTGEITLRGRYNKFLSAGIGYRYNDAVTIMLGGEFKGFFLGYSYDYPVTSIARASSGSHEVWAGYSLKLDFSDKNKNKHKSIRIM